MTAVLTCPRCLQSRSFPDGAVPASCVCPFCHYELEAPLANEHRDERREHPRQKRPHLPAAALAVVAAILPLVLAVVAVYRSAPVLKVAESAVAIRNRKVPASTSDEKRKPQLVYSGQIVHASPVVMDQRFNTAGLNRETAGPARMPAPSERATEKATFTVPLSSRGECMRCHNSHTLIRRALATSGAHRRIFERLDDAKRCPAIEPEDAAPLPVRY